MNKLEKVIVGELHPSELTKEELLLGGRLAGKRGTMFCQRMFEWMLEFNGVEENSDEKEPEKECR